MIAKVIALYVKENNIKQSYICKKTGLSKYCLCCTLKGKRKLSIDEYEKICYALNLPYSFFFDIQKKIETFTTDFDKLSEENKNYILDIQQILISVQKLTNVDNN